MKTREQRFWEKVDKTEGCWLWKASLGTWGYGAFQDGKSMGVAHRVAYELTYGQIPTGMQIDHICRNKRCVNPEHLRAVNKKQNQENRSTESYGASGFRNVHRHGNRWRVSIKHNGKTLYLGRFRTIEEAASAARIGRITYYTHNDTDRTIPA